MVNIEGINEICYVASSSHLSHFIDLENKTVILRENISKNRTMKYILFAVNYKRTKVLLELSYINNLIINYLIKQNKSSNISELIKREHKFKNGYKADVVICKLGKTIIIEAKSLLSYDDSAEFPIKIAKRAIEQLVKIKELLMEGYEVYYWLVLLNPKCQKPILNKDNEEFTSLYQQCSLLGMKTYYSRLIWSKKTGFIINSFEQIRFF